MNKKITVICAWCSKTLREEPSHRVITSHGICERCKARVLADVPVVNTCPHGEPVNRYCLGCEATVGGNHGA